MIKKKSLKIGNFANREEIRNFVYNHNHGNIFQTPDMAEVYSQTNNYKPVSLTVVDGATDEILAVLQAVVIKEKVGLLNSFSARSILRGGPLFVEDERGLIAIEALMGYYDRIVSKEVLFTEIRNIWNMRKFSDFFYEVGYECEGHLNFLIDLTYPLDLLWKQLYPSKRKGIKKAKRQGVTIEEVTDKSLVPLVYDNLRETYKNAKLPLADLSLFESTYSLLAPKNMTKFFLAKYGDKYIGARVVLLYKGVVYDWYAGASRDYLHLRLNDILAWHVIEWGAKNGYHTFDFGGAGKPNEEYGVREFKKEFGGKLVNFGRCKKIYAPLKMKVADMGFKLYRSVFIR